MKINLQKRLFLLLGLSLTTTQAISQTTTFSYTGAIETYTVPSGVSSIQIETRGGQGGYSGGLGAIMVGTFAVTPGQVIEILVGGEGVTNTTTPQNGGSGGGGSFAVDQATGSPLIVSGGGGGGCDVGGFGSYSIAYDPAITNAQLTENGATTTAGLGGGTSGNGAGAGYMDCCLVDNYGGAGGGGFYTDGQNGSPGEATGAPSLGGLAYVNGGTGGSCGYRSSSYPVTSGSGGFGGGGGSAHDNAMRAGGGGGYSGGQGSAYISGTGYLWGGGGGSFNSGTDQANSIGNTGNGQIIITELCDGLVTTVSSDSICDGEEVTLAATSTNGGTISWDGGITDGVAFAPSVGTTTYTATSTAPEDCDFVIDIFVGALPSVDAGTDVNLCEGDTVLLHGMGTATDWSWDGGITDSVYFTPGAAGTTTYTLTGTIDSTGCMAMDMVDVTYNVIDPSVTVTGVTLTAAQAGATYQWVNCPSFSLIGGATNQAFAPSQDGSYAVIINLNGCVDTSACETIAGVGISDLDNLAIKVLPNPNNGTFQLSLGQAIDGTIVIFGLDGKIIRSEAIAQRTNIDFSFENLDAGVYMMQLNTALGNSTVRIVVQ